MEKLLSGISVTCFVGSYLLALALEFSRALIVVPARTALIIGFTVAGLVAQAIYLFMLAQPDVVEGIPSNTQPGLLADWYSWSLLLSWAVAIGYFVLLIRRPDTTTGYFLLPAILVLIVLAVAVQDLAPFERQEAASLWRNIHGFSMLLGAATVLIGFLAGVMYLIQSSRLKRKRRAWNGLRLPTLEWLQRLNRGTLVSSTFAVALGTIAGVIMNLNAQGSVAWTSRGIIFPCILLLWLLIATAVEFFYRPAREGRKVAYLTLASFGFLLLAMGGVLGTGHGGTNPPAKTRETPPEPADFSKTAEQGEARSSR